MWTDDQLVLNAKYFPGTRWMVDSHSEYASAGRQVISDSVPDKDHMLRVRVTRRRLVNGSWDEKVHISALSALKS